MTRRARERGQVVVFIALLMPVLLSVGSVVLSVGNWYVLKRHLQTQVDAAALAGGAVANGCQVDAGGVQTKIKLEALKYAGDLARAASPYNQLPEDQPDVHVVLNSTNYWNQGDPADGTGLDWTMGTPCDLKRLDVKATDDEAPLLFRWIPLHPSLKTKAVVEIRKTSDTNGVRPIGVPEFDPVRVAALFVDEGVAASSPFSITGKGFINKQSLPSADPLSQWNTWRGDVSGINLNNTSNHSVVILSSRDPGVDLNYGTGSLEDVCGQDPVQTRCFMTGANGGLSFIHVYNNTGGGINPPAVRDVQLAGGCASDLSAPYFNLDGIDFNTGSGCTITVIAKVDFLTGGTDPTGDPTCARLTVAGGTSMTYNAGSDTWIGSYTFPSAPGGRYLIDLDWTTRKSGSGPCSGGQKWSGTLQDVAGAYVSDADSDVVEYLKLENAGTPPPTDANSWPKTVSANIRVTVGFVPPLRDLPLDSLPMRLRFEKGPSQTQALDCDGSSGAGPNGWNGKMATGCGEYQVNERTPTVNCTPPDLLTPPDCIPSQNGNFNAGGIWDIFANPTCSANNWNGVTLPPDNDIRWIPLFILDERSTTVSGKKYYPVRRFGSFYVTAGDGIAIGNKNGPPCGGDAPARDLRGTRELWGHFSTYVRPGFGNTVPDDELCPFNDASLCVVSLVE
jgi:hypothetical protein